ncbi:hypothetical protein CHUAL_000294 [Chamberlinius hualienensis]
MEKIKISAPKKSTSISLSEIGLSDVVHIFWFYGFNIDLKVDRMYLACVRLIQLIIGFIVATVSFMIAGQNFISFFTIRKIISLSDNDDLKSTLFGSMCVIAMGILNQISFFVQYLVALFSYKKTKLKLQHLAKIIRKLSEDNTCKNEIIKKMKMAGFLLKLTLVIITASLGTILISSLEMAIRQYERNVDINEITEQQMLVFRFQEIVYILWVLSTLSSYVFNNLLLMFLCRVVNVVMDYTLPTAMGQESLTSVLTTDELAQYQKKHRAASKLIDDINDIFSPLLLNSLMFELSLIVVYTRGIEALSFNFALPIVLGLTQLSFFVLKNLFCSSVNSKILERLSPPKSPRTLNDLKLCDNSHIKYLLYLKNFNANPSMITYGNLFAVDKNFIISIIGTLISYSLFLREF